jgi:hypothetical protein
MKMLITSLEREFKLIYRNGISLFMALAPAILAVVFIIIFGTMRSASIRLAVDNSVSADMQRRLERIADIETFSTFDKLTARVESPDSTAGVFIQDGKAVILLEGNEGTDFTTAMQELIGRALATEALSVQSEAIKSTGNLPYDLSMISVLLLSLFIGGATVGLSVVTERETDIIHALTVSPQRFAGYTFIKLLVSAILCVIGIFFAVLIMEQVHLFAAMVLLSICSIFEYGFMIFVIGAFAANQIGAIGILKLVLPLSLILPVSSAFVPEKWHFMYYILPSFWQYRGIESALNGTSMTVPCLLTIIVGIPWFIIVVAVFVRKTKMRIGR